MFAGFRADVSGDGYPHHLHNDGELSAQENIEGRFENIILPRRNTRTKEIGAEPRTRGIDDIK